MGTNERFTVKFVSSQEEMKEVEKLRFEDMLTEYRSDLQGQQCHDLSEIDDDALHLIVYDNQNKVIAGYYRMLTSDIVGNGSFVCEEEFDISALKDTGCGICELSRAVVKKEYRSGVTVLLLWKFIINYCLERGYRYMVGDVSFVGTDRNSYLEEISYLANNYGIDAKYNVRSLDKEPQPQLLAPSQYDEAAVKRKLPTLFKAYTAIGGKLSAESFVDYDFGSVDLFVLVDLEDCNMAYINRLLSM